jgi:peptidoglycan biosynthesis protein MviN/MurJ (putative lipid II flippase)
MAAGSGVQAVLYLSRFGTNARTDGFFVAFAVYTTFGVFAQSLRLTSVPLLVGSRAKLTVREFTAALVLLGVPVVIATGPLAGPVAQLLAPGLSHAGRSVTAAALPVLGAAMMLQLLAAGAATVLAVRDRFAPVASAYIAGAVAGLAVFLGVLSSAGVQSLGWSMLAMAVVTCATMVGGVIGSGGFGAAHGPSRPVGLLRAAGLVLGGTPVYLAFNMLFVITLAFASSGAAGNSTVLSYAYLFASYLVAGTGTALGMSRIPEMTRRARLEGSTLVAKTVPQGYRYAMLLVAPAMAGLITAGAPLIHALLPHSLTSSGVHTLRMFTALLAPWTVVALLVNFLLPTLLATGRTRLLNLLAVPLVAIQLGATALANALFGISGVVGAIAIAPACLSVVLLLAGAGRGSYSVARQVASQTAAFAGLAVAAFGVAWAATSALPGAGLPPAVSVMAGAIAYLLGLRVVARRQVDVLLGALAARRGAVAG